MKYQTLDNGGQPFEVEFKGNDFTVRHVNFDDEKGTYSVGKKIKSGKCLKYWIGKSPKNEMTTFSGGHGPEYDGNSILIQLTSTRYLQIGWTVYEFTWKEPILDYISPVGNSSVPYPYAVVPDGYLLCIEEKRPNKKGSFIIHLYFNGDPYQIHYKHYKEKDIRVKMIARRKW